MGISLYLENNEASRWVANELITNSDLDFKKLNLSDSMKQNLVAGQAKINKLKEEKNRIEKEAFPIIDELDILQKQLEDKEFNQKARMLADDLDGRNIRPDFKANQMSHMRKVLDNQLNEYHTDSEINKNKIRSLEYEPKPDTNEPTFENPLTYALPPAGGVIPGVIPPAPFGPTPFGPVPFGGVPFGGVPFGGAPFAPLPGVPPVPGVQPYPFAPPFGIPGHPLG